MPLHSPFTGIHRPHFLPKNLFFFRMGSFFVEAASGLLFVAGPVELFRIASEHLGLSSLGISPISAGLLGVSLFYLLQRLGTLVFLPSFLHTVRRLGLTPSLALGSVGLALKFATFPLYAKYPWLFPLVAMISGFSLLTYWVPFITYLSSHLKLSQAGKDVSSAEFVINLAQVLSPLLGSLLFAHFGYWAVFFVAGLMFFIGAWSFLQLPNLRTKANWKFSDYQRWMQSRENILQQGAMGAFQWERFGTAIFWPIFLFLSFQRVETVGYILTSATLLSLLLVYITGWVFDRLPQRHNFLRLGTGSLTGFLWIPRLFLISSPVLLVFNDALDRLIKGAYSTIFVTLTILRSRQDDVLSFFINREITISVTTMFLLAVFSICLLLGLPWESIFITFILASAVSLLLPKLPENTGQLPNKGK